MEAKKVQKCLKKYQKLTLFLVILKEKKTMIYMEILGKLVASKKMSLIVFLMICSDKKVHLHLMNLMIS